ncbi:hypothetical protein KA529_00245 [Candidatus Saccharibacteria bacterium]|nr:hypothetical protein [Candidatus Saccharibacteria bacterium]
MSSSVNNMLRASGLLMLILCSLFVLVVPREIRIYSIGPYSDTYYLKQGFSTIAPRSLELAPMRR